VIPRLARLGLWKSDLQTELSGAEVQYSKAPRASYADPNTKTFQADWTAKDLASLGEEGPCENTAAGYRWGTTDRSRVWTKAKNKTENFHLERHNLWSCGPTMGVLGARE